MEELSTAREIFIVTSSDILGQEFEYGARASGELAIYARHDGAHQNVTVKLLTSR